MLDNKVYNSKLISMNKLPSLNELRDDTRRCIANKKTTQSEVCKLTGLTRPILCNFLNGRRGLSYQNAIALWPFVYGLPFPQLPQDFGVEGDSGRQAGAERGAHGQPTLAANG